MDAVVLNGVFVGVIYGLVAVGLVVTYRCSRVINFAYGEIGMLGAFVFMELWTEEGVALGLALAAGVALSAALSGATELLVIRPLRDQPRLTAMVGTLAVGAVLLTFAIRRYGVTPRYPLPIITGTSVEIGGLFVSPQQWLILGVAIAALLVLGAIQRWSGFGLRMRASALDPYAAGLVGVNNDAVALATWLIAGGLAGVSAILIAPTQSVDVFFMTGLLLRSLAAALVGGLTSIGGAMAAGVMLGVAEAVIQYETPAVGATEAILAVFVIVLLLVRPSGLVKSSY
jgi:branched-subunit amino acid ABC-type transport system permease component